MRAKVVVAVLLAALLLYLLLLGQRGWLLIASGQGPVPVLFGLGVLLLPLLVAWAVLRELVFGVRTEAMARELDAAGRLPVDDLPRTPSGRVQRAAADAAFARYRAETEADPQDWGGWFRLGCAYDAAGDRRRARRALRHASALRRARSG
ncbi:hypothetical protein [Quadrisphaera sp. DSM 44207]|uniref:hypothetical protein n=1 Tax=Quadrisphaera sp. DSM 44207 TaxID=1881057 RepID=UPI000884933D|nr:hypothetical protein [Quadrisphaera sp. DSM 44207]SDQ77212.1 hypothetical protein SAMN05428996_2747 [Quadrisphaera sp. DSM 44207]